jgi:hypothetical protein
MSCTGVRKQDARAVKINCRMQRITFSKTQNVTRKFEYNGIVASTHGQEKVCCGENAAHSYSPGTNTQTSAFTNEKFHLGSISKTIFHNATRGEYQERVRQQNHHRNERSCAVVVVVDDIKCWPHC